jgi:hypothetical protein
MKKLLLLIPLTAALNLALIASAGAETYGGDATAAQVTVPATGTTIRAATGTLPVAGGGEEASVLVGDIPGSATGGVVALSAGAMHSATIGVGKLTSAESSMGDLSLAISGNQITSDFVMARSKSHCDGGPHEEGQSQIDNLVVNGQPIVVTGAPNQTLALPNGTLIINEQIMSIVGNTGELRVNALHVTTRDAVTGAQLADVKLATVDSRHGCEEEPPKPNQGFTKGAGKIQGPAGPAKFGFFVSDTPRADGTFKGHLVYKDPGAGFWLQATSITVVDSNGSCVTTFSGQADSSNGPGEFSVTATDDGESGVPAPDTFSITAVGYAASGALLRGDIEIERFNCPN